MPVGIEEFDRDLHAGAPASFEDDLRPVLAQMLSCEEHFIERGHLEGEVMQFALFGGAGHPAYQRHAVMIGIAAHEYHAARHHLFRIDIGNLEAEHASVEIDRALQVGRAQDDVPDLRDPEVHGFCFSGTASGNGESRL